MHKFFKNQKAKFSVFSRDAKALLKGNLFFAMVIPFILIFSNAYIWRSSSSVYLILFFMMGHFFGNPLGFLVNGLVLRKVKVKDMFVMGMFIYLIAMMLLVYLENVSYLSLISLGVGSGIGSGLYWSNRNLLTVTSTVDENRSFFNGLDYIFLAAGGIISPLFFGLFIGLGEKFDLIEAQNAYQLSVFFAVILVFVAAFHIRKGSFETLPQKAFFQYKFNKEWNYTRLMCYIMGFYHFAILTLPAILILNFIGNESSLGIIDASSNLTAFCVVYIVSSRAKPHQRHAILMAGTVLFMLGAIIFGSLFSSAGVLVLQAAFYLSDPLLNISYRAIFMNNIDNFSKLEGRNPYTYLVDLEGFNASGRITASCLFLGLYYLSSFELTLIVTLIFISLLQFLNLAVGKRASGKFDLYQMKKQGGLPLPKRNG